MKIIAAIPAYNCARQIKRVLGEFDGRLLSRLSQVIVIDNQSTDDTIASAKKAGEHLGEKFRVWRNDSNYSLGGSHKVAFLAGEKAGADYVAILHGDHQATTKELNLLLDMAAKYPEVDAILGTRFMKGSKLYGYDWKRIWGNRVLNWIYTMTTFRVTRDLGSGLNLFKLEALADHRYLGFRDALTFNFELLLDLYGKRARLINVPITWKEEDQVSNARNFKVAWIALKNLFAWRFGGLKLMSKQPSDYTSTDVT